MERTTCRQLILLLLILILAAGTPIAGQGQAEGHAGENFQNLIYRAYRDNRMPLWESTLETMRFEYSQRPDGALLYDILLAQYGLIGYYLGHDKREQGVAQLERAEKYLEKLDKLPSHEVSAMLFRASFNAYHITLRPWRGIQLGPATGRLIDRALEMDPNNPRAHIEKGNMLFFAPAILGGSKTESIRYYSRAIELYEDSLPNNHRWLYLATLVSLANAYEKTGDTGSAVATLEKALEFEPGFLWVRDELLPAFLEKTNH